MKKTNRKPLNPAAVSPESRMPGQLRELLVRIPASPETDELQDLLEKMCRESDLGNKEPFPLGCLVKLKDTEWPARITAIGIGCYQLQFVGIRRVHTTWFTRDQITRD